MRHSLFQFKRQIHSKFDLFKWHRLDLQMIQMFLSWEDFTRCLSPSVPPSPSEGSRGLDTQSCKTGPLPGFRNEWGPDFFILMALIYCKQTHTDTTKAIHYTQTHYLQINRYRYKNTFIKYYILCVFVISTYSNPYFTLK